MSEKPRFHDDPPVRFWHACEFASVEEVMEHVAAGGVQVIPAQTSAPSKSSDAAADAGAVRGGLRSL